jgi:TRAP-type C4-dicarboxylate transport system permease small subunit
MSSPQQGALSSEEVRAAGENYRRRLILCSSLFITFFVFYIASAVIQTPAFASIAGIPVVGMPLGLLMSLLIFPVSWAIIVVFFVRWR